MALRDQSIKKAAKQSDTPVIIYIIVIASIGGAIAIKKYNNDLSMNLVSELLGAAFTLFVIDVLLVKAKARRWKVVQKHIDYLIARNVNRLRDGLSTKAFSFQPMLKTSVSEVVINEEIRKQREKLLLELSTYTPEKLSKRISPELFTDENYEYFNEKADEFWNIINMKYSEYLPPSLVLLLIELHTNLKDLCSQMNIYKKHKLYPEERAYYQTTGLKGASNHIHQIVKAVVKLKEEGYSDAARTNI
jgi:hypothetical protein